MNRPPTTMPPATGCSPWLEEIFSLFVYPPDSECVCVSKVSCCDTIIAQAGSLIFLLPIIWLHTQHKHAGCNSFVVFVRDTTKQVQQEEAANGASLVDPLDLPPVFYSVQAQLSPVSLTIRSETEV